MLQENAVIGHPGRRHRRITMAIPFASMPLHSFHAQMAARFFACALIIVPLAGRYMSFRPRMDFDGQNHAKRPSRQSCVWLANDIGCVYECSAMVTWKCHHVFWLALSLVATWHDAVTKCWGTFVKTPCYGHWKTISTIVTKVGCKRFRGQWKKLKIFHFPTPLRECLNLNQIKH